MPVNTTIRLRRGTTSEWTAVNSPNGPVLSDGELGLDSTLKKLKVGDGTTAWASLPYIGLTEDEVEDIVNGLVVGVSGISTAYDDTAGTLSVGVSGIEPSQINGVTASASEINYLDISAAGTAEASKALVLDSSRNIANINNMTLGGDLTVHGTTTTVNSTEVNIGDNVITVNTSGLSSGGFRVYDGTDHQSLLWNESNDRWEFTGGNVHTTGNYIGDLTGNADTVSSGFVTLGTTSVNLGETLTNISGITIDGGSP